MEPRTIKTASLDTMSLEQLEDALFCKEPVRWIGPPTLKAWQEANSTKYNAARDSSRLGPTRRQDNIARNGEKETRRIGLNELEVRLDFSPKETDHYYRSESIGAADTLARMQKDQPLKYGKVKLANDSYRSQNDLIPKQSDEGRFLLNAEIAARFHLPAGYKVNSAEFAEMLKLIDKHDAKPAE